MPYKDYNKKMNEYMKRRWKKRRSIAVEYLGSKCVTCGSSENLDFDHINPETKICSIAKASSFSEERFWQEVDKCQLLCKEHHIEKHRGV
jgi:5-methylcytosine-specific restriction endonuclease McrA